VGTSPEPAESNGVRRALVRASGAGVGARHVGHWRDNAVRLLRGHLRAAIPGGQGVRQVLRWMGRNERRDRRKARLGVSRLYLEQVIERLIDLRGSAHQSDRTAPGRVTSWERWKSRTA
jgi:hypothetical protein